MAEVATPRPASTVILLRDGQAGLETLLVRRNKALKFAGGLWVFPGGALEDGDLKAAEGDLEYAARLAAVREAREETGLEAALEYMRPVSHWVTPTREPRRFATWFFAAPLIGGDEVQIDGSEIHDARWVAPAAALAAHGAGELGLLPPTFVTLSHLARYAVVDDFLAAGGGPVPEVRPVLGEAQGAMLVMFGGDAGYESGDASLPGPRHRVALLDEGGWQYQRENLGPDHPSLVDGYG